MPNSNLDSSRALRSTAIGSGWSPVTIDSIHQTKVVGDLAFRLGGTNAADGATIEHGHARVVEHHRYEGAGHLFGLPFSTSVIATENPYIHGGSIERTLPCCGTHGAGPSPFSTNTWSSRALPGDLR